MGERQRVVEEEERAKMAALAEQMSNESAQREGEVRRRHEAAMAKLAVRREQQVPSYPQPPDCSCLWSQELHGQVGSIAFGVRPGVQGNLLCSSNNRWFVQLGGS